MSNLPSLKAMAENKVDGVSKMTIFTVDPDVVEFEEGFNLREEGPDLDAHLEALYQAMKSGANVPPIDVSVIDGRVIARDGHCRTRNARRLKAEGVPYLLQARQFRGNEADCVFHMISSAQGKSLTPLEAGRGFLRLLRYNLTVADIVRRTGLSRTTVDNGIILAEAPVEVQALIAKGGVSCQVALETLKQHGEHAAEVLQSAVRAAQANGVTRVTKKHVSAPKITQAVANSFVSATRAMQCVLATTHGIDEIMAMDDDEEVRLPAKVVKELLLLTHAEAQ